MIIDCHAHCFPEKIAARALSQLRHNAGNLKSWTDGTVAGLKKEMAQLGIDRAWVLNIATTPRQQAAVNQYAATINGDLIDAFGSVHPDAPDALNELDRIVALGLKGVKFHPYFQNFSIDDPKMVPLYRRAAQLGLITVFHTGYDIGFADNESAAPAALARVLSVFDGAPVVAAHLGGSFCWQAVQKWLVGLPVYLDTSFCCSRIPLPEAQKIIDRHDPGRLLFGTDLPWSDPAQEMAFVASLGLSQQERAAVMGGNANRLLPGGDAHHA